MIMVHFTKEQISDIITRYQNGETLNSIGEDYSVSRPTIQKIVKGNYPEYTGKKRALKAVEGQTKICSKCKRELPLESYNRGNSLYGRRSFCRECEKEVQNTPEKVARRRELELIRRQNPNYVKHRNNKDRERVHSNEISYKKSMLRSAKQRAINKNLDFNIDISDIVFPEKCPLLNIPMSIDSDNKDFSYSLDRIDSSKGYIKGNVWVISFKANRIKADATLEELELIAKNLKTHFGFINKKLKSMDENLNLVELLKGCPKGTKFYSRAVGAVTFDCIKSDRICIKDHKGIAIDYAKSGKYYYADDAAEIDLFPSKDQRDWSKWQRLFKEEDIVISDKGDIHLLRTSDSSYCAYRERWCSLPKFDSTITTSVKVDRFATEEEKQKLFDAIKANGYKWNPETKTLEKLKKEKFDIKTLKPFESRVLVSTFGKWVPAIFGHYNKEHALPIVVVGGNVYAKCIPYEGNEHLIDTFNQPSKFYRYWEN